MRAGSSHGRFDLSRRAVLGGAAAMLAMPRAGMAAEPVAINGVVIGKSGWLFATWDAQHAVVPRLVTNVTNIMNEAIGILKAKGIATAVTLLPARSRLYGEFLPDGLTLRPEVVQRYSQALRELRAPGTVVPDLATALADAKRAQPQLPLFFKADTHWMPAGAETAAIAFAKEVLAKVQLPPSTQPGTQFGTPVEMEHVNDLARLLPAPQRDQYPLQTYMFRPPVTAQNALLDTDKADVAVVGNSYMQPKYGFSAMVSYQMQRPVSLMWDVNQVGPYQMLLRYLASDMFRQQRPKLIVWNIHEMDLDNEPNLTEIWGQNSMTSQTFLSEVRKRVGG
jgi:alginate O-acetyltransferase complex protein AlgJ